MKIFKYQKAMLKDQLDDHLKKQGLNREDRRREMKKWKEYFGENNKKSDSRNS